MKLDTFFDNFGLLADAPNGVQKLREMILQLAVQGKLVPQDPKDEPASLLFEKIQAERIRVVKEKQIRKSKPLPPIKPDEMPHKLPAGWEWVRLGDISIQITDGTHFTPQYTDKGIPFLSIKNISQGVLDFSYTKFISKEAHRELIKRCKPEFEDILICRIGTLGKPVLVDVSNPFSIFVSVGLIKYTTKYVYPKFLLTTLNSPTLVQQYDQIKAGGSHTNKLNLRDIPLLKIPIPPLKEQKRIVAKVDELMALCDELKARKQKVSINSIQLNDASIHKLLTAREPKKFSNHWQRICESFDLLYSKTENVTKLRQAVLQLAVQGKLVPQDPKDEPASVLLEKIKAEKERLIKEGKIKKPKPLPSIGADDIPYSITKAWEWTRLGNISINVHYGYTASANNTIKDVRLLRITDIQNGLVDWENVPGCEIDKSKVDYYVLSSGDLLIARTGGTIGKTFLVEDTSVCAVFASYLIRVIPSRQIYPQYLKYFATSPLYWEQLYAKSSGTGQPNVNATSLKSLITPLPPLNEQKRIVAKVDELMALCDELETILSQSQTDCDRLMEAAVAEILAA